MPCLEKRPRYALAELLAACDLSRSISDELREWVDAPALGREVLASTFACESNITQIVGKEKEG